MSQGNEIRLSRARDQIKASREYQKLLALVLTRKLAEQRANDKN